MLNVNSGKNDVLSYTVCENVSYVTVKMASSYVPPCMRRQTSNVTDQKKTHTTSNVTQSTDSQPKKINSFPTLSVSKKNNESQTQPHQVMNWSTMLKQTIEIEQKAKQTIQCRETEERNRKQRELNESNKLQRDMRFYKGLHMLHNSANTSHEDDLDNDTNEVLDSQFEEYPIETDDDLEDPDGEDPPNYETEY
jgi:hypothetical protein